MPKTNYPFLQKWKQAEKKNSRPINRTNIMIMGGPPLSGAQPPIKSQFTGFGEDGQLQPGNPVEMVNTQNGQKLIHEGEVKIQYPDGTTTVIPAKDLPQDKLRKMQEKGMQGFQAGGSFKARGPWPGPNPIPTPTPAKNPLGNQQAKDYAINPISGGHDPISPLGATGIPKMSPNIKQGIGGMFPDIKQGIGGMFPDIKQGIGGMSPDIKQGIGGMSPDIGIGIQPRPPATPFGTQAGGTGLFSEEVVKPPPSQFAQPGPQAQALGQGGAFPAQPGPQATGIGGPVAPIKPDIEEPPLTEDELKYQQTLQKLTKLSEGESELDKKIREEERARFKGEEQAGKGSLEQQLSQLGMTGREALLERAMAGRGFAAQEAEVISNLRKGQADRAFQASMALPGATLAGMKFELDKKQWEQMSDFEKEKWNWDKSAWQKQFDQDKNQWDKMFDLGKEKWDYGKKLDMVQALMQQGGADNFAKASDMLESMFGQSVDFSNALNAENQGNFFAGMDLISSSLASGLSWEDTMKALEQGGLLDQMGMTEGDVKGMYEDMKLQSDPLYQAQKLADQWVEQGIMTQDEADDYMAMIKYGITNPEGFDISDGFGVFDDKGNEVDFFKTQEEADAFIAENAGKGYTSKEVKDHVQPKDTGPGGGDDDDDTRVQDFLGREPTPEELALFGDIENEDFADAFLNNKFKDLGTDDLYNLKDFYDKLPDDYKDKNKLSKIVKEFSPTYGKIMEEIENENITHGKILKSMDEDSMNEIKELYGIEGDIDPNDPTIGDEHTWNVEDVMSDFDFYVNGYGWKLNEEAQEFVEQNKGKYFENNGRVFKLIGKGTLGTGNRKYQTLKVYDPLTNQTYDIGHQTANKGDVFTWDDLFGEQDMMLTDSPNSNFINDYYNKS